ncbi:hypothetical protein HYU92_01125 [Candidatus Curtissbacteria bacterium]|nr:hypothetical protein [Candidatus Curtissbacteria bacterium]
MHPKKIAEIREYFSFLIASLNNSGEIENFLDGFLTDEEKVMLSKRLVLLMMLKRGYLSGEIASVLSMSYESIRTYKNLLVTRNNQFHKTIKILVKRDGAKEFWQKVDKILKPLDLALRSGTDMKARAKLYSGDWN